VGIKDLYVAKGKRIVHFDLRQESPDDEELTKLLLGPTGNLRAPTVRKGQTLVVGFNSEPYDRVIG
jgi:arsenate reductase-like glutaredoxin family protein